MITHETSILLRNILLLQLLAIAIVPDYTFGIQKKLLKLWKSIVTPISHKMLADNKGKFWEIDMTKFEP